jgi:hypothetical protein
LFLYDFQGDKGAVFSPRRTYRYALWRWWDRSKGFAMFVGLNPSTADESEDDATLRRCRRFAVDWGYGGVVVTNLFALRARDPKIMLADPNPIGFENDVWLRRLSGQAGIIVAAWGARGGYLGRDEEVLKLLGKVYHLGLTKAGKPKHPLYLRADTKPVLMA